MIRENLLMDFSRNLSENVIFDDLYKKYHLTNVNLDDDYESMSFLWHVIENDYKQKWLNYRGYISRGINARFFFELRRNLFITFYDKDINHSYYMECDDCKTLEDLKQCRLKYVNKYYSEDYIDADWQYVILVTKLRGISFENFIFDFDPCFGDRHSEELRTPDEYYQEYHDFVFASFMHNFPKAFGVDKN